MEYYKGDKVQYKTDVHIFGIVINIKRPIFPRQTEVLYEVKWETLHNPCTHVAMDLVLIKRKGDITAEDKYGYLFLKA